MLNERLIEANRIVNRYLLTAHNDLFDYNWEQFVLPLLKLNCINVVPFQFSGIASELQAGSLAIYKNKRKIFYNSSMSKNRINFTVCHETGHFIFDTKFGETPEYLASSFLGEYDEEEAFKEMLTDATAGVFMCPDIVIVKYMETKISFIRMAESLQMSQAALYVRLTQFIITKTNYKEGHARKLVNNFRYNNDKYFIMSALTCWGSNIKKEIIYEYENCL